MNIETYSCKIPVWALNYLVNGDAEGLTDKDFALVRAWEIEQGGPVSISASGVQYFSSSPAFGLPCDVEDCEVLVHGTKSEPAPPPNCGYAEESFVVQYRFLADGRLKNWRELSGELPSFEQALAFVEAEKRAPRPGNRPERAFRIVGKRIKASVIFEDAE